MARHVIVDGSNIATEGRSMPSLKQLNEAVTAFMQEFPDDVITVVVDATFGHRIDPTEVPEFDEAVAHNELVAPPAGAIGRGDSFILSIANKTKGSILTNDSYQEFHGQYPWVFDEGRLIGGKPVPNVGWVFVLRTPVRGPVSRKSVRAGRSVDKNTGRVPRASKEASRPMPVPKAPPPGAIIAKGVRVEAADAADVDGQQPVPAPAAARGGDSGRRRGRRDGHAAAEVVPAESAAVAAAPRPAPARDEPVNELMAFIDFVEHHPVGSSVNALVESYSSHGAYVAVGNVRGYVPLRLMSDPPARSARELGKVGDAVTLVVHSFTPARRSIDMAVPAAATKDGVAPTTVPVEPHAAETAAIAEAAVIASATDTTTDEPFAPADTPPAKPSRRSRKATAAAAAIDTATPPTIEPVAAPGAPEATTEPAAARKPAKRAGKRAAAAAATEQQPEAVQAPTAKRSRRAAATEPSRPPEPASSAAPAKRAARTSARIVANLAAEAAPVPAPGPAKRAAKRAAGSAVSTDAVAPTPSAPAAHSEPPVVAKAAKKAPAKKATAKKPAAETTAPAKKVAPAKKAPAEKAAPAKKAPATTTAAAKKAPAKQPAAKKAPAKRPPKAAAAP